MPTAETPLSVATIHRMQGLINGLAGYDLDQDVPSGALYLIRLEATSIRLAIEAEYGAGHGIDVVTVIPDGLDAVVECVCGYRDRCANYEAQVIRDRRAATCPDCAEVGR